MIIYFLRHASAGQHKANPSQDDKRPLDQEGVEQCTLIGRALASLEVQVDFILSSPLKRATQTASLVGNEIGFEAKLVLTPVLRPNATFESFRALLDKYSRTESIMVVGHNPSLSQFASLLISAGANESAVDLKKGAVARVDSYSQHAGEMKWCLTPKIVRAVHETKVTSSRPKTSLK